MSRCAPQHGVADGTDWKSALPVLQGKGFTLRELRVEDAPTLLALLTTEEVARFISPPTATVEAFVGFIERAQKLRAAGNYLCFGVVPEGGEHAVGIFQVRALDTAFVTAEWGFAVGSEFWGTGLFNGSAKLVIDFTFNVIGASRLEARAAVANSRGNGALRKIGAVQEGWLRQSFIRDGVRHDQVLWSIVAHDWRLQRLPQEPTTGTIN